MYSAMSYKLGIDKYDPNWDEKILIQILKDMMLREKGRPRLNKEDPDSIKNEIDTLLKKAKEKLGKNSKK
jgi:hypothetical protein